MYRHHDKTLLLEDLVRRGETELIGASSLDWLGVPLMGGNGCIGAVVEDRPDRPHVNKAGLFIGGEIGLLANHGYQMFWETPSGKRMPAQASQLRELHEFQEDLKEGLGLTSLYNLSLGTTSDAHMYDRVTDRDQGPHSHPWDK